LLAGSRALAGSCGFVVAWARSFASATLNSCTVPVQSPAYTFDASWLNVARRGTSGWAGNSFVFAPFWSHTLVTRSRPVLTTRLSCENFTDSAPPPCAPQFFTRLPFSISQILIVVSSLDEAGTFESPRQLTSVIGPVWPRRL